jgi:quinol monooxygenase YgiN
MATILAHLRIKPGSEARFEAIAAELYAATHTQETKVRRYEYWRGAEPGAYYTLLAFDDHLAFLEHQTSDHHETASGELREVIEDIRLEWVDPIANAAPLPATAVQPLPDDADNLTKRYYQFFFPQVADWWSGLRGG